MSGEFDRVARLRAIFAGAHRGVILGIGDDAAILAGDVLATGAVLSTDAAIEDVHFRRAWIGQGVTWRDVAYRAAAAALSDLAAMGAEPRAMLTSWAFPRDVGDDVVDEIARGFRDAADVYGAPVIGGNLARAREIGLTTTVIGAAPARAPRRDGAQAGDVLWATGALGEAALGLAALEAGIAREPDAAAFVSRFVRPPSRIDAGRAAAQSAHAMIDVSDGLLQDLGHLCDASGVGARLDALAPTREADALARRLGVDARALLESGGDDYELLITAAPGVDLSRIAHPIGEITREPGIVGATTARTGFDHFG
ncbi:thiamine-phosphate kinase [Sandaracinus amylolyticus]|uniref:Thiamine-monophosphate kinase n=1 Tax=Sandaracinus amylolyticus TaxID=927083 RepID=A0A0F6YIZ1_9BACT|nr:thiamine-phosphate kinase [Sandaracinus amylolyticus]AKF07288.1 Thiamine-monophosphate kinase [Sandaracinus amylolyticus]